MNLPSTAARRSKYLARSSSLTPSREETAWRNWLMKCLCPRETVVSSLSEANRVVCSGVGTGRTRRCRSRLAHRPERGLGTVLLWLLGPRGRSRFGPCRIAGPLVPDGRCSDRVCPDQDVIETRVPPFLPRMSSLIEPLYSRTCMDTADGPQATAAATVEPGMHTQLVIASGDYSAVKD